MSDADEGGSGLDCVICMTPVPITCHAEDRMVSVTAWPLRVLSRKVFTGNVDVPSAV